MNQVKKTIHTLLTAILALALAACQPDGPMDPNNHTTTQVETLKVEMQQMQSMANTPANTRATYQEVQPKIAFTEGDVIHIAVAQTNTDVSNSTQQIYTATRNANDTWMIDPTMMLPQDATKTYYITAFYNGTTTKYANFDAFNTALEDGNKGTLNGTTKQTKYIDLLIADGNSFVDSWSNTGDISLTPTGQLTIKMHHRHALVSIASTTGLSSPIATIVANLVGDNDATLATVPLPLSTATTTITQAMAGGDSYLKSFTLTLNSGTELNVPVPDRNNLGNLESTDGKGTYLLSGNSYTYRLSLIPGNITATIVDNNDNDWSDKPDPNAPTGYTAIYNRAGLEAIKINNAEAKYILMADIDLTPGTPDGAGGTNDNWEPIGYWENGFNGTFNGNGHIIKGMVGNSGLFGVTGSSAILYNIHLREVNVKGNHSTGALVGTAYGTISGCSSTGTVVGTYDVGGLVGYNYAHITRCWSTAKVSGNNGNIGGLVGYNNNGAIVACYTQGSIVNSSGTVNNDDIATGGLVGRLNNSTIFGCYASQATVSVTRNGTSGINNIGALVGATASNATTTTTSSYATNAPGSSSNKLVGSTNVIFTDCISPLIGATGETTANSSTITGRENYAPLTTPGQEQDSARLTINLTTPDGSTLPTTPGTVVNIYQPQDKVDGLGNLIPHLTITPTQPINLAPGAYQMLAIVPPAAIDSMNGVVVGFNPQGQITTHLPLLQTEEEERTTKANPQALPIASAPNFLAATATITLSPHAAITTPLQPLPMTHPVALALKVEGTTPAPIQAITTRLHGVLAARPQPTEPTNPTQTYYLDQTLEPTPNTDTTPPTPWITAFRLLGTATTTPQHLLLTVTLEDGTVFTFTQDLTALFLHFNTTPTTEVKQLQTTLTFSLNGIEATINPWTEGWDEEGAGM